MEGISNFKFFRVAKKLTQRKMALDTGVIFSTISNLESGKQRMTYALISKFIRAYPQDFVPMDDDQEVALFRRMKDENITDFPADILCTGIGRDRYTSSLAPPQIVKVLKFDRSRLTDIFDWTPFNTSLNPIYYYTCEEQLSDPDSYVVLEMVGDSMADLICDGSLVLCQNMPTSSRDTITNGYYALAYEDELTICRVKENDSDVDYIKVYPRNPNYAPVKIKRDLITLIWKVYKIVSQELTH